MLAIRLYLHRESEGGDGVSGRVFGLYPEGKSAMRKGTVAYGVLPALKLVPAFVKPFQRGPVGDSVCGVRRQDRKPELNFSVSFV